jgi:hypothetical protein
MIALLSAKRALQIELPRLRSRAVAAGYDEQSGRYA